MFFHFPASCHLVTKKIQSFLFPLSEIYILSRNFLDLQGSMFYVQSMIFFFFQFRFLHYMQGELPSYWVRYGEGVVQDLVEATSVLLSCSYSNPSMLAPSHFMALFDPRASWFRKWTVRGVVCVAHGVFIFPMLCFVVTVCSMGSPAGP